MSTETQPGRLTAAGSGRSTLEDTHGLAPAQRSAIATRVASSAGKKHSMRSSCSVTSWGVPKVVIVEKKLSRTSLLR